MSLKVFIASRFESRLDVRELNDQLRARGMTPTATWCNAEPEGPATQGVPVTDWFESLDAKTIASIIYKNDQDILSAHVMLMLAHDVGGRESYAEVARALHAGIPIVWTGPTRVLSAYRRGVKRLATGEDPVAYLEQLHAAVGRPWPQYEPHVRDQTWKWIAGPAPEVS